jgi:hypothetical protein
MLETGSIAIADLLGGYVDFAGAESRGETDFANSGTRGGVVELTGAGAGAGVGAGVGIGDADEATVRPLMDRSG